MASITRGFKFNAVTSHSSSSILVVVLLFDFPFKVDGRVRRGFVHVIRQKSKDSRGSSHTHRGWLRGLPTLCVCVNEQRGEEWIGEKKKALKSFWREGKKKKTKQEKQADSLIDIAAARPNDLMDHTFLYMRRNSRPTDRPTDKRRAERQKGEKNSQSKSPAASNRIFFFIFRK